MYNPWNKISHFYFHDLKLKYKFVFSHLILALTPTILISILAFYQLFAILSNNLLEAEQTLAAQTKTSVEAALRQVETASLQVVQHPFLNQITQSKMVENPNNLSEQDKENYLTFTSTLNAFIDGQNITHIQIYLEDKDSPSSSIPESNSFFNSADKIKSSYWWGILNSSNRTRLLCPSLYLTTWEKKSQGELALVRSITFPPNNSISKAYVMVYFSQTYLQSILEKNINFPDSVAYLINEDNSLVAASNSGQAGKYFLRYDTVPSILPQAIVFQNLSFAKADALVNYQKVANTNWYMISALPSQNLFHQNYAILLQFILLYLMIVILVFFVSFHLSNSIVKRLSKIIEEMQHVQYQAPQAILEPMAQDEIGNLVSNYNYMVSQINFLMDQQIKVGEDLREAEFLALQSQINPHFLYNTLDMINWLAQDHQMNQVAKGVSALAKFYKLTLGNATVAIFLQEELSHASLYVDLQNMRFENKIHLVVDIPDHFLHHVLPKFILQPLVENAIQHGILEKPTRAGKILITAWVEETDWIILVSDDGVGMSKETLENLLLAPEQKPREKLADSGTYDPDRASNIGIYNTHQRIQHFYSSDYGLKYYSQINQGTDVEIHLPWKENKE